ncbi:PPOX class F420-dependent oxidoreductase [Gordonia bronchialis]|uniref:PPOX class F420-dependent oxidoreductase n=1 Tax=Gordonia bronchialis TaxID=2054 RepID=UPI002270EC1D|nr:PPOX class F420-dependent oxidoreductase [Gordonia bronchialis]
MAVIPAHYVDLLERPLFGHLATSRPDGGVQVSPMWFDWDGELLRFTHTRGRQRYRNIQHNPHVAMSVTDPDDPYRYLEVRGTVDDIVVDPTATFFAHLNHRYRAGQPDVPSDAGDRVILVMRPTAVSTQ